MRDDATGNLTGNFLPGDPDTVDALRLADVLDRVEAGHAPDLDPTEDPVLSHLLTTAMRVRSEFGAVRDEHAFHSFHTRSRAAILHSLERPAKSSKIVPFYRRPRILAPFAAVAAAAAIAISAFGPTLLPDRNTPSAAATNLTPREATEELDRLTTTIADIQERAQSGQSVSAPLLRAVSEGTARVANIIEQNPERVSKETVTTYIQAAQNGQNVLKSVTVDQNAQGALAAAQRASSDGVIVAGRFLSNTATTSPTAIATGTPTASPTATGTTTGTPTASPTATGTTTGTPTASPTGTATKSPTATPATGTSTPEPPSDIVR